MAGISITNTPHETYYSKPDDHGNAYYATFGPDIFSSGVSRCAFKGTLHGSGPRGGESAVVKIFKKQYGKL
jgi:hypothetical protein